MESKDYPMTRINVGIPPQALTDQHLLAEHREIKRLPAVFAKNPNPTGIPAEFTLGTGHVKFFLDKGKYTLNRYKLIYAECIRRGFEVTNYSLNWEIYKQYPKHNKDYRSTKEAAELLIERISERLRGSKQKPRYYKKEIAVIDAMELLSSLRGTKQSH
jgi:deoxyribonuclease (pyrimidine dimer)